MSDLSARIAASLRRERERRDLSVSELARRAGVAKATVSQLENGGGNPSVETLWALASALEITFADFVDEGAHSPTLIRAGEAGTAVASSASDYIAVLLSASPPHARRDIYLLSAEPGSPRRSDPHPRGTIEHLVMVSGRGLVGPADAPFELAPGDYLSYAGDAPHVFEALTAGMSAVCVVESR
ncbi:MULTISPECIES: helix-turn-helix domain-containing protein [unclassified Microbacterium]|jgi:transcriptional regulator with XRE-family HTH domain|uniref:helix-turn-helix domain-containing protein n=1 Tax=unclassified Microbacterium TaxID=2609290 RepID=UPI0011A0E4B3|nr:MULTISPECIES: XRE family transcriptional regulator [unclassified Microbacterium]MCY1717673.1 XRE family transcriptional regulator [Microbacterium sp. SL62]